MLPQRQDLQTLVRNIAREELLPRFQSIGHSVKADGSLLTEADLAVDRHLQQALLERWPDIAFLSEEMEAAQQTALLAGAPNLWILDPLDGTSNFAAGLPFYATSLALLREGRPHLGIVYDQTLDECFSAVRGEGAWLNGEPLRVHPAGIELDQAVALVDFKRLKPALSLQLAQRAPYRSQRNLGACALEWAWMAAGRGHLYLHGGMKLWDHAAGSLILAEAGGHSQTLTGEAVFVARMESRSVVASPDKALFDAWTQWLAQSA